MAFYNLCQNAWNGNKGIEIFLPDNWKVQYHEIAGDDRPVLKHQQIRDRINNPIGLPPLKELAQDRQQVVIIFDDISRGTPSSIVADLVLEELINAGINKKCIRFICAVGAHGAMTRKEFVQKLSERIVSEYPVFNHNPYENTVQIGVTRSGVPVKVNRELMNCDLKIGIGGIVPHPFVGFGGGGKILFPGVADIETIIKNHCTKQVAGVGNLNGCHILDEIEEMTKMVGEFFKIDLIYNSRLEIVELFSGDVITEYRKGRIYAKEFYVTDFPTTEKDIVILNANAKINEANLAFKLGIDAVRKDGKSDIVLINHCPYGQVVHYIYTPFGRNYGGRLYTSRSNQYPQVERIIYFTPYPDYYSSMLIEDNKKIVWAKTWTEVLELLSNKNKRGKINASLFSDATIQCYP